MFRGKQLTRPSHLQPKQCMLSSVMFVRRAMLSGLILIVFIICYCCHRNMSKQANRNAQYWHEEPDVPLEIFTVDGQRYEVAGVLVPASDSCASLDAVVIPTTPPGPPPPPSYDAVVSADEQEKKKMHQRRISHVVDAEKGSRDQQEDDGGLPSYEAALRFEAQGTSDRDSNLDLPVIGCLIYCEGDATKAGDYFTRLCENSPWVRFDDVKSDIARDQYLDGDLLRGLPSFLVTLFFSPVGQGGVDKEELPLIRHCSGGTRFGDHVVSGVTLVKD
uniref:Uncharacterized protein n=1 Tax=Timema douglasi TaxID=61478 RepID=A0A7R8VU26_TIMDO|nr:unnamed protein product [Timema douglasi]